MSGRRYLTLICLLLWAVCLLAPGVALPQEDLMKLVEKKKQELAEKEESLKKEEERLRAIRKDVEERIEKYTKILGRIEESLKTLETSRNERLDHLVKVYEAMPPEDAAARLSAMDEPTATRILFRMKSKKAGAVMAVMEPQKAATITESITRTAKKFPTR